MTEAYHKARRLLALFSGILIAWEYVGLRIGEQTGGPVTAKLPITETVVTIQNAEVIPVVVMILTIYFGFRLAIEWFQCDAQARTTLASKTDLRIAYFLASAAVLLIVLQRTTDLRLADFLTPAVAAGLIIGIWPGVIASVMVIAMQRRLRRIPSKLDLRYFLRTPNRSFVSSLVLSAMLLIIMWWEEGLWVFNLIAVLFGWCIVFIVLWLVRKRIFREPSIPEAEETKPSP
jgi:hypothetical protein